MRLNERCRIELASSRDKTRVSISHPWLEGDKLIATDGAMMAVVKVELDPGDTNGIVTKQALAAARKDGGSPGEVAISTNGALRTLSGVEFQRPTHQPPNTWQVWPKDDRREIIVRVDAKKLWDLAQAVGAKGPIEMHVPVDVDGNVMLNAILVKSIGSLSVDASGLIMPVRG